MLWVATVGVLYVAGRAEGKRVNARGSLMAGAAEELVGDPTAVSESGALLAQDLLDALGS